ncbi:MAG: PAS domain S-box protein [Proteobacteria bacterium]|nr:PAS domain S-box protein [Pseudomonadota bacterium]
MDSNDRLNVVQPCRIFYKPLWLFVVTLASILVAEAVIMLFIELAFEPLSIYSEAALDAFLLAGLAVLPLYFLVLRPMMRHVQLSAVAEADLLESNSALRAEMDERVKVEGDLRLFRDLMDQTKDSVLVIDPETSALIDINNTACTNLGYSRDELLDRRVTDVDGVLTDKYLWKEHVERVRKFGFLIAEGEHIRSDGTVFAVEKNVKLVQEGDKSYIITVVRDITERRKSEAALQALVESTVGGVGQEFFDKIVISLREWLDVDVVIIGEIDSGGEINTLSMQVDSEVVKGFSYPLAGTPCEVVINEGYGVFMSGVSERFPDDKDLIEMNAEGYIGMSLVDKAGRAVGVLCAISRKRLTPPRSAQDVMRIIAGRVSLEIERMRAETELHKLSHAVAQSPVTVVITDAEGTIEYVNPKFTELTGYKAEEVIGKSPRILKSTAHQPEFYEQLWETITSGRDWRGVFQSKKKDGGLYWEDATISPVLDAEGVITNYLAVKEDITERKEAEEAIKASERRYRTLFEDSLDVVFIATPEGELLDINAAGVELFGYSSCEEMLGLNVAESLYQDAHDRERLRSEIESRGFVRDFEVVMKKKDGAEIIASITASSFYNEDGCSVSYRGIIRDKTAHKKLEAQLLQSQKMDAIGQLAGGVAHDFNNILTSVVLFTHLAMDRIGEEHEAYGDLKQVFSSAERAKDLTRQLLIFSRKQPLKCIPLSVNDSVNGLSRMLDRLIGEDVEIVTALSADLASIEADKGGMDQLVMNLTVNARDAMPEGGRVVIKTDNVELGPVDCSSICPEARPGSYVRISVRDNGTGIDGSVMTKIFDPFYTTKEQGKGTGLGLAVVHGIAKKHGGWIDVESTVGEGTTFSAYFPSSTKTALPDENALIGLTKKINGRGERVLLVEDEDGVREPVAKLLGSNGYNVFEASNAEMAREIFERENGKFNMVLSDVVMPGDNGLTLVSELKEQNPKLNVLLMSGHMDQKSQWSVIHEKGYKFVSKPYTISELLDAVDTAGH